MAPWPSPCSLFVLTRNADRFFSACSDRLRTYLRVRRLLVRTRLDELLGSVGKSGSGGFVVNIKAGAAILGTLGVALIVTSAVYIGVFCQEMLEMQWIELQIRDLRTSHRIRLRGEISSKARDDGLVPMRIREGRLGNGDHFTLLLFANIVLIFVSCMAIVVVWLGEGGSAWSVSRICAKLRIHTPKGPRGWPVLGSWMEMRSNIPHRKLATLARQHGTSTHRLMSLSVGCTRIVVTSDPTIAKDILRSAAFAERPLKQAAMHLHFSRAMGFAVQGPYWLRLRQIASSHLFSPKQITVHHVALQRETSRMLLSVAQACDLHHTLATDSTVIARNEICLRPYLQRAAVNNIMSLVFGRHYEFDKSCKEAEELEAMIREGFEVLGAFNWADHLPVLCHLQFLPFSMRCTKLMVKVESFVLSRINEHRCRDRSSNTAKPAPDFVDVLLSLDDEYKLSDSDMTSVLWEMLFRGTDTIAVLTEWALAEVILRPEIQKRIQEELDEVVGMDRIVEVKDIARLPYLQAFLTETLRCHPPGPLLSWARLATENVKLGGYDIPKGTTAMVNMWAITHDPSIWRDPDVFNPSRFLEKEGGLYIDVRGADLRLAPFGSGRRVCPGRALGIATSELWLARLLHHFSWSAAPDHPVDLTEDLKLSCEMASPLHATPTRRLWSPI